MMTDDTLWGGVERNYLSVTMSKTAPKVETEPEREDSQMQHLRYWLLLVTNYCLMLEIINALIIKLTREKPSVQKYASNL